MILPKYVLHFWYCAKRKPITNISNHVNTDWLIISLLNTVVEKKLKLGKQNVETDEWLGNLCKALKTKHCTLTQVFLTHLVGVFLKQNYPKYISDVVSKILEEKKHSYQMFCLNLWLSWNWVSCGESWQSLFPIILIFDLTDFGGFLVCY